MDLLGSLLPKELLVTFGRVRTILLKCAWPIYTDDSEPETNGGSCLPGLVA